MAIQIQVAMAVTVDLTVCLRALAVILFLIR